MKKLALTIAIVLGMGMTTIAQERSTDAEGVYESGLFGMGKSYFDREGEGDPMIKGQGPGPGLPGFGSNDDEDAPLGSGIAVLTALGAAYLVGKRRKED